MQLKKKKKNPADKQDKMDKACKTLTTAMAAGKWWAEDIAKYIENYIYFRHDENCDSRGDFDRIRFDFVAGESGPFIQVWHKDEDRADRIVTSYGKKPNWPTRERYYPDE